jgi:hypothetical protein
MSEETNLLQTMDAKVWADEFNKVLVSKGEQPYDPGWLIGWFANSIMCGYDHAHWKLNPEIDTLRQRVAELEQRLKAAEQRMDAYWRISMKR